MTSRTETRARQFINTVCDRLGIARNSTLATILAEVDGRKAAAAKREAQAKEDATIEQWANARKR